MTFGSARQEILDFVRHLLSAVSGAVLYTMRHPQVDRLATAAHTSLSDGLIKRPDIALLEVDGELVIDGEPQAFSLVLERFIRLLREFGIGHLRFLAGATREEVNQLIAVLARQSDIELLSSSIHIRVGKVELPDQGSEAGSLGADGAVDRRATGLEDIPELELERLNEVYEAVKRRERLRPSGIALTVSELIEAIQREGEALLILAALRQKDEYTFTHAANVCILTLAQAMALGIEGQLLNDIGMSAMLHDIGKMLVPDEILTKSGRLTEDEFAIMKQHPILGARYLSETSGVPRIAPIVAFEHHIRFNATGYPAVPLGWGQTVASQMTAIADCFDAMRTKRPYQEPREAHIIASALVRGSGTEFNPLLVKNMLQILTRLKLI